MASGLRSGFPAQSHVRKTIVMKTPRNAQGRLRERENAVRKVVGRASSRGGGSVARIVLRAELAR